VIRNPLRREPSWSVAVAVPDTPLPGTDTASWLTARPRSGAIATVATFFALALGWLAIHNLHYAIALAAGIAVIAIVGIRPVYGALGLVAVVPALSGLVPGIPIRSVRLTELLIGTVGVTLLVVARRSTAVKWAALDWLLLAYGLVWTFDGVLGAFTTPGPLSLSSWGTVVGQLQFFLLYRSLKVTLRTSEERHLALRILFIAAGAVALLAVFQEAHLPGVVSLVFKLTGQISPRGQGGIVRATGPFTNWAALAGYLVPLILIALCLGLGDTVRSHRKSQFALAMLLVMALFFTAELSAITTVLVGACVLGLRYGRMQVMIRWLGIGLLVMALAAGTFLGHRLGAQFSASAGIGRPAWLPQTLGFRWAIWTGQYIPAILERPFTGWGVILPNTIRWPNPESQYINFLLQGGVPLLATFGLLFMGMYREAKRAVLSIDPVDRALGEGLLVGSVVLLVVNLIWPFLSNGGAPQMLWCLFAILPPALSRTHPNVLVAERPRADRQPAARLRPRAIAAPGPGASNASPLVYLQGQ
jgi:hypothetical protein